MMLWMAEKSSWTEVQYWWPVMSALAPKADVGGSTENVRYGPKADMHFSFACAPENSSFQ
jgi:hypothetical protein